MSDGGISVTTVGAYVDGACPTRWHSMSVCLASRPRMVRAVPVAAVTLTTYDMVKYSLIGAAPSSPAL